MNPTFPAISRIHFEGMQSKNPLAFKHSASLENAQKRARVAFEFIEKLGVPYYAFHDRDIAPEGATLVESNKNLDSVVRMLKEEQERTGIKLLWGTACLFANPRFLHGAATSPNASVYTYAAAQVKKSHGGDA